MTKPNLLDLSHIKDRWQYVVTPKTDATCLSQFINVDSFLKKNGVDDKRKIESEHEVWPIRVDRDIDDEDETLFSHMCYGEIEVTPWFAEFAKSQSHDPYVEILIGKENGQYWARLFLADNRCLCTAKRMCEIDITEDMAERLSERYPPGYWDEETPAELEPLPERRTPDDNETMIDDDIRRTLLAGSWDDSKYSLANEKLERKFYVRVNSVIEDLGGKWSKKQKVHEFNVDDEDRVRLAIKEGVYIPPVNLKKQFQDFQSPDFAANRVIHHLKPRGKALEPSAGRGKIAFLMRIKGCDVTCAELQQEYADELDHEGFTVNCGNFLDMNLGKFDCIGMNPPFSAGQDISHVIHAFSHLNKGGQLVSIMSPGWQYRSDKRSLSFRNWLSSNGGKVVETLPRGTFKESGTMIETVIVKITR